MSHRPPKFPHPHLVFDDKKEVYYCPEVASWAGTMACALRVSKMWPGYKANLCTKEFFEKLTNEQKTSS